MHTIYLALGSNIGNRKANIEKAIVLLRTNITHRIVAPIYETKPVGFAAQENFYNTVIKGQTNLSPEELLTFVKSIEQKMGRIKRFPDGPREIDIDIIFYDDLVLNSNNVIIPHPRMHERDFVLQPLTDIDPNIRHPFYKKTVKELYQKLQEENKSVIFKVYTEKIT